MLLHHFIDINCILILLEYGQESKDYHTNNYIQRKRDIERNIETEGDIARYIQRETEIYMQRERERETETTRQNDRKIEVKIAIHFILILVKYGQDVIFEVITNNKDDIQRYRCRERKKLEVKIAINYILILVEYGQDVIFKVK